MSALSTIVAAVTDARLLASVITGSFTLGAVRLTNRLNQRQRDRERDAAADAEIKAIAQELFESVGALHLMLMAYVPAHNSWQPKMMDIGMSVLEYFAGRAVGGHFVGVAQSGRVAVAANQRELEAALALQAPVERVLAVAGKAALLPSGEVREAALRLSQAAAACGAAYGQDNLWQRKKAAKDRDDADTALYAALGELLTVVNAQLHLAEEPRRRWWSWRARRRAAAPTAVEASVPQPRAAVHDERATGPGDPVSATKASSPAR